MDWGIALIGLNMLFFGKMWIQGLWICKIVEFLNGAQGDILVLMWKTFLLGVISTVLTWPKKYQRRISGYSRNTVLWYFGEEWAYFLPMTEESASGLDEETQINCIDKGSFRHAHHWLCYLVKFHEEHFKQAKKTEKGKKI